MLHSFSVSNYRSIRETVELNLSIPGTTPDNPCFRKSRSRPNARLPTIIALYGPNGSGKTTLLRAMHDTLEFAMNSFGNSGWPSATVFWPFPSDETVSAPTIVQAVFDASWPLDGAARSPTLCRYTLEIERNNGTNQSAHVGYEALHIFPKGRPKRVLERRANEPVQLAKELKVPQHDPRLSIVPPTASAISTFGKTEVSIFPSVVESLRNVWTNIAGADPWRPDTDSLIKKYRDNPQLVDEVSKRLERFDLGIEKMEVILTPNTGEWHLVFPHRGLSVPIHLLSESSGTRHFVHIFPLFAFALETGYPTIMDALDNDFHTELLFEILGWFRQTDTNPSDAQLFCSLHNPAILDDLEKEEVFIVEKSVDGTTSCHGAASIEGLRRDSNLQKRYRSGELGGVPVFG